MEALRDQALPPGFGFHPTDPELISYLRRKILGLKIDFDVIEEIDIYKHEPWDLPAKCNVPTRDSKWHFFASRDKKYPNGARSNRTTGAGYWKSTGKDRSIRYQNRVIGTKKTLVFHEGRPPSGKRSDWIMHEYYVNENEFKVAPHMKDAFVLCRVTKRNGWELDGQNVSSESNNIQAENVHDNAKEPKESASSVVPVKSSTPSESTEDIEAWFNELFDPNFSGISSLGEVKCESEEGISSLALNYLPEASEDSHLLFPIEEFCDILQSDVQGYDVFGDLDIETVAAFADELAPIDDGNNNTWAGIQRRERQAQPPTETLNHRFRLQVRKMESRNGESLSGTVKMSQSVRFDPYGDEKQATAESKPRAGARTKRRCLSSARLNCFFMLACGVGTAALILCFSALGF